MNKSKAMHNFRVFEIKLPQNSLESFALVYLQCVEYLTKVLHCFCRSVGEERLKTILHVSLMKFQH